MIVLHNPGPKFIKLYFNWLSKHYNIISLEQYLSFRKGATVLPNKSLIITLDDGYAENYKLLPIIKSTGIPVSIFLCSGIINTNRHFWFKFNENEINSESLKFIPNHLRIEFLAGYGFHPQKELAFPQALNKDQITEMKEFVNFQGHTVFHPCLNRCTDVESWKEIYESKKMLESDYGMTINAIAYPNGDYTEREIEFAKKAGYACGLTVDQGVNGKKTDLYKLRRFSVGDEDSLELLAVKTSGIWAYFSFFFRKIPRLIKNKTFYLNGKLMRVFVLVSPGMEDISWL